MPEAIRGAGRQGADAATRGWLLSPTRASALPRCRDERCGRGNGGFYSQIRGIQQVRILGRLQRRGGPGPVLLVAAAQIGQDLLEAGGIALFHQLLVPAAGADLVTGGDEQL